MLWGEPGLELSGEVGIDACCGVNLAWGCGGWVRFGFWFWSFRAGWQGLLFVFGGSGLAAGFSLGGEGSFDWATRVTSLRA